MAAPKGNQFWQLRDKHGRNKLFEAPDALWTACCEYFEWVEANPLMEAKAFANQGAVTIADLPKMRAMTLNGLHIFLEIDRKTWDAYREREEFASVCARVDAIIREQKFTGAAAGLLNPVIIARELGLADKQELSGPNGSPIETKDVSARDLLASRIAGLAARSGEGEGSSGSDGSAG
ncbi:hypothetical protein ABIF96_005782 [Bradyrhizobium ottawaense]|uniref:DNA-packaging protein n=1 Tax=Bradyrhizobium ottawaense TaxID=931866 RepID=UPI0038375229